MRGNAPWHCRCVCYALGARGIFVPWLKNAECFVYCNSVPRALPWAMGNIWAFSPPQYNLSI